MRAPWRQRELEARGQSASLAELREEIRLRDTLDSQRSVGPLKRAADARLLDTTHLDFEQQVQAIVDVVLADLKSPRP